MATAIRPIGHDDRLSLVDHLDELRTRLIVSAIAFGVAFGVCLWQNHALLHIINRPLDKQTQKKVREGHGTLGQVALTQQGVRLLAQNTEAALAVLSAPGSRLPAATRAQLTAEIAALRADAARIPAEPPAEKPTTLGIGEPFTATLTVALYFALLISLPIILFELYGFVLPALRPSERRVATPLLAAVPFLFAAGVVFGYFVVLPAAVRFFQNFNSGEFNVLVQASQFYKFAVTVLLAMGVVFQVPVLVLGATRVGLVTPAQLRHNRRYAIVACAAIAAFLPGDAVTLLLETIPLYVLYEASILLASFVARRDAARERAQAATGAAGHSPEDPPSPSGSGGGAGPATPPPSPGDLPGHPPASAATEDDTVEPSVRNIIDHIDRELSD